jgi:hypothetical protein
MSPRGRPNPSESRDYKRLLKELAKMVASGQFAAVPPCLRCSGTTCVTPTEALHRPLVREERDEVEARLYESADDEREAAGLS